MRVAIYTDTLAEMWHRALHSAGHTVTVQAIGAPLDHEADVVLIVVCEAVTLLRLRFWLAKLTQPTLIVTPGLLQAEAICRRFAAVRLICHPTRAVQAPADFIEMTRQVFAGHAVFGPLVQSEPTDRKGNWYDSN